MVLDLGTVGAIMMSAAQKAYIYDVLGIRQILKPEDYTPPSFQSVEPTVIYEEDSSSSLIQWEGAKTENIMIWLEALPKPEERQLLRKILSSIQQSQFCLAWSEDGDLHEEDILHEWNWLNRFME